MAIERYPNLSSEDDPLNGTHIPQSAESLKKCDKKIETKDLRGVQNQYANDSESQADDGVTTGTVLPRDLTVKLVRADTVNWETFLSCLYSLFLTFFGLFLGSWISSSKNTNQTFSFLEKTATIAFGIFSILLIGIWIYIKIRLQKRGVIVPHEDFQAFKNKKRASE